MLVLTLQHGKQVRSVEKITVFHWGNILLQTTAIGVFDYVSKKVFREFNSDIPEALVSYLEKHADLNLSTIYWNTNAVQDFPECIEYSFHLDMELLPVLQEHLDRAKQKTQTYTVKRSNNGFKTDDN